MNPMKSSEGILSRFVLPKWRELLFLSLAIGCPLFIAHTPPLNADDERRADASATPEKLGKSLFERMQASRAKLKSGVFEAHRVMTLKTSKPKQKQSKPYHEEKMFCAFDFDQDLLRFDAERSVENSVSNSVMRYYTTRTAARLYTPDTNILQNIPPHWHLQFKGNFHPFDLRLVGICNRVEFERVTSYEKMVEFYTKECTVTGKPLQDNKYLLALMHKAGKSQVRREIVLDASRDFVPVQFVSRYRNSESEGWRSSSTAITAEWKKSDQSDVYLPVKLKFPEENADDKITFAWKLVNQPPDQKLFTQVDLKIAPGTQIIDATIPGKPELEQP